MFVDGVKDAYSTTLTANAISGSDPTTVVGFNGPGGATNAVVTDVVVVKTALTDAEILAYAKAPFI